MRLTVPLPGKDVESRPAGFSRRGRHGIPLANRTRAIPFPVAGTFFRNIIRKAPPLLAKLSDQEQAETRLEYARLKQEHADFDAAINAMMTVGCDPLQIQRMKKKKLVLKDRLKALEDRIVPDIIA
jgi:hypothetical protein